MRKRLGYRLSTLIFSVDILISVVCLYVTSAVRPRINLGQAITWRETYLPWTIYLAVIILWAIAMLLFGPHHNLLTGGLIETIGRLVTTVSFAELTFAGMLYISLRDISRLQFLYFAGLDLFALVIFHLVVRSLLRTGNLRSSRQRVLVVGDPAMAEHFADAFSALPWSGLEVVGYTNDNLDAPIKVPRLGTTSHTLEIVAQQRIDEVIFALPAQQHGRVVQMVLDLLQQPVMLHMIPGVLDLTFARTSMEMVAGIPLISLRESVLTDSQRILKRLFDLVSSAALLMVCSPLCC